MGTRRVVFRFAPGTLQQIEGVEDLLDLDDALAEMLENTGDDQDADHVVGTSELWDQDYVFADVETKDPDALLELARRWLEENGILDAVVIAVRSPGRALTVLHPANFEGTFESPL